MAWTTKGSYDYLQINGVSTTVKGRLVDVFTIKTKKHTEIKSDCVIKISPQWENSDNSIHSTLANALIFCQIQYGMQYFSEENNLLTLIDPFKDDLFCFKIRIDNDGFLDIAIETVFHEERSSMDVESLKNFKDCEMEVSIDLRGILGKMKPSGAPVLKLDYHISNIEIIPIDYLNS